MDLRVTPTDSRADSCTWRPLWMPVLMDAGSHGCLYFKVLQPVDSYKVGRQGLGEQKQPLSEAAQRLCSRPTIG